MTGGKSFGRSAQFWMLAVITLLSVSGCVKVTEQDSQSVYTYEPYVFFLALLGSIAAAPIGWFLRKKSGRVGGFGWAMLIVGPILLVCVVPGLWSDFVKVDDQGFELKTGFWFVPTLHKVDFNKLTAISLTDETRASRRGRKTSYFLQCTQQAGPGEKVPVGDMMKKALDDILLRAAAHNVVVIDQRDGV